MVRRRLIEAPVLDDTWRHAPRGYPLLSVLLILPIALGSATGSRAEQSPTAFAERAKGVVEGHFEDRTCEVSNPQTLICGEVTFGLDNLRRTIAETGAEGASIDAMILQFFGLAWAEAIQGPTGPAPASAPPSGDIAASDGELPGRDDSIGRLRPQLVPSDYEDQVGRKNLETLVSGIEIAIVIDEPERYTFVLDRHIDSWAVRREELRARALENLSARSGSLEIESQPPSDPDLAGRWLSIDTKDGFAAARILLPKVRKKISEELGETFFVAFPNRDFLVAWSRDFAYHLDFVERVQSDFESRPHPLSPEVYIGSADGVHEASLAEFASGVQFDWGDDE